MTQVFRGGDGLGDKKTFASPAIAEEMQRVYGNSVENVEVEMKHEKEILQYVLQFEKAHQDTAKSKLTFR